MKSAEAAKDKEKDSFSVVAGNEHRRRMAAALAATVSAAEGMAAEVTADADRLEQERGTMLVPQISALVGCQVGKRKNSYTRGPVRCLWMYVGGCACLGAFDARVGGACRCSVVLSFGVP